MILGNMLTEGKKGRKEGGKEGKRKEGSKVQVQTLISLQLNERA